MGRMLNLSLGKKRKSGMWLESLSTLVIENLGNTWVINCSPIQNLQLASDARQTRPREKASCVVIQVKPTGPFKQCLLDGSKSTASGYACTGVEGMALTSASGHV